jgi:hypothetical protein
MHAIFRLFDFIYAEIRYIPAANLASDIPLIIG